MDAHLHRGPWNGSKVKDERPSPQRRCVSEGPAIALHGDSCADSESFRRRPPKATRVDMRTHVAIKGTRAAELRLFSMVTPVELGALSGGIARERSAIRAK